MAHGKVQVASKGMARAGTSPTTTGPAGTQRAGQHRARAEGDRSRSGWVRGAGSQFAHSWGISTAATTKSAALRTLRRVGDERPWPRGHIEWRGRLDLV